MLAEKIHELLPAHLLHDQPRNHKIGVRILPFRARLKIQRLLRPLVKNLFSRVRLHHRSHQVVLRPIVLVARSVAQDLPDRHFVATCQSRNILTNHIIQRKLALLLQDQNCRRCELLRNRPN